MKIRLVLTACVVALGLSLCLAMPAAAETGNGDDAYTAWLVAFNNPGACAVPDACTAADVGPATQAAIAYFTGTRVQSNGTASFAASYGEGSTVGTFVSFAPGGVIIVDDQTAEIHFLVRSHSKYRDELADMQLTYFDGGCDVQECFNAQAATFSATGDAQQTTTVHLFTDDTVEIAGSSATLWREGDGIRAVLHTRVP